MRIAMMAALVALTAAATEFRITCDHADAKYRLGEDATFTVEAYETNGVPLKGMANIRLDNFGDRVFLTN